MIVDIHTHFIPKPFIEAARQGKAVDGVRIERVDGAEWVVHPQGYRYPLLPTFYEVDAKLQHMDRLGIDVAVMSIAPTLFFYWTDPRTTLEFCQMANEELAAFVRQGHNRLSGMATVPLQDPEAAAAELRRAVQDLGLRGALIGTSVEQEPLDAARLEPFFAAAEALDVPVVLHPYYVGMRPEFADFYLTNLVGNPLDTTVAAARLIFSGFLDRHPRLKVVLVHAGGFLPYQIGRLDHGFRVRPEAQGRIQQPPSAYLRRFYFDTITHAARPLQFLVDLVGADRVMVGTDIPFDMADDQFAVHLAALPPEARIQVSGQTAIDLFQLDPRGSRGKENQQPGGDHAR